MGFDGVFRKVKGLFFVILCFVVFRLGLLVLPFAELDDFQNRQYSTRILDRNGNIIQILALDEGLRREFTSISEIPSSIQSEFIKAEDKRFYFHFGVDLISVTRALFQNLKDGRKVSGASTITMQLARMISPSDKRGIFAKLKDSINAIRIEGKLSKKEILELYLNNVPFGKNSEGITTAARTFYEKNLSELCENEIKELSMIPRNPSIYNNLEKNYEYPFEMPHYVRFIKENGILEHKSDYKTTLDLPLQKFAEGKTMEALRDSQNSRISNAAVLVLDSKTGEILAWVGSQGWSGENGSQIDGVLNKIQPGSSMKPFLYALALDNGFSPNAVLADVPKEFGDKNLYIPQNFNNRFNGPVLFRMALASSLNIPAVSLLSSVSVKKYAETLEKLGFDSLKGTEERFDLGLALGAGEVSLKELSNAFRVFVNDGKLNDNQIYSTDSARLICSILSDKNARSMGFGYSQTFATNYPSIFKTGTSNQYQNIVALGATRNYTVGVWMGNFSGNTVIGKTGSSLPAFIAKSILDFLEKTSDSDSLSFPEPINFAKKRICAVSGMSPSKFCKSTVLEYVDNNSNAETKKLCDWHTESGIFYPSEYQRWLSSKDFSDVNISYDFTPLTISSPKDGSIYYFDSSKKLIKQFVPFDADGGNSDTADIFLDGEKIQTLTRPFLMNLPITFGFHKLTVNCGGEEKTIEFSVR